MLENSIFIINVTCSFLVVVPLLLILASRMALQPSMMHLSVYLTVAFFTESAAFISSYIFKHTLVYSGLFFCLFEVVLLCSMLAYWNRQKMQLYYAIAIGYFLIWFYFGLISNKPVYTIVFGVSGVVLIAVLMIFLIDSFKLKVPTGMTIIVLSFLFYKVLSIAIYAFMDFFNERTDNSLILYYSLINSFANAGLYLLMSIGIIRWRKQLSAA